MRVPFSWHPPQHVLLLITWLQSFWKLWGAISLDFFALPWWLEVLNIVFTPLEKCLLRSSAHFYLDCFLFFFFDIELHKLFIYFGYFSPLSDRSFANIFSSSGDLFSCFWWLPSLRFWMQFKLIKDLYWLKMPNGNVKIIFLVSMFWRTGSHACFEDKPQGPMLKLFLVICDLGIGERDKLFCNLTCC